MPFQEVVEAEGHLIDSHIMENIFDKVVEYHGRFEVEQFRIGRTNSEPSYLRLKVETPDDAVAATACSHELLELGCAPVDSGDAALRDGGARPLRAGRFLLHHQSPHPRAQRAAVDRSGEPAHGRHDRGRATGAPCCRRLRDLRAGDRIVVGLRGIRVIPESKERDRLVVRLHVQRHLLGAPGGDRRAADRRAGAPRRRAEAEGAWWWPGRWWCTPAAWRAWRR